MSRDYPPYIGPRLSIAVAVNQGGGPVAGRVLRNPDGPWLIDASGEVRLLAIAGQPPADGDWVAGLLTGGSAEGFRLDGAVVHAPRLRASPDPGLPGRLGGLKRRAAIVAAARTWFAQRGFLEVETPVRVPCPGLEPHLRAFPAGSRRFLITSPELHLKRLLAAGVERLVEFARAFRDDEHGPWHRSEFSLLEWYRAFEGLGAIEADCEGLVSACVTAAGFDLSAALPVTDLTPPFARTTVREALRRRTGLDLAELQEVEALRRAVVARGHAVSGDDTWDDLFFRVWIAEIEPTLGCGRPEFVHDYPASQAALARVRHEPWGDVAERFELYIAGVEVANAFHELNDPVEQRRRHEADRRARDEAGQVAYPLDESFLAALESGMPPAAGIALGLDRLVALLSGASDLDEIRPFLESPVDGED